MSLRGYVKKGRPALWKQIQDEAGEVTYALNVRTELRRQEREAKRQAENRRRRIEAAQKHRARQQAAPRKRIAPTSDKRRMELVAYGKARRLFLKAHPVCQCCPAIRPASKANPSDDVHHTRGRQGRLLNYEPAWLAVCRPCHDWIGAHPMQARAMGFIAPLGQWNTPPVEFEIAAQETRLLGSTHEPATHEPLPRNA